MAFPVLELVPLIPAKQDEAQSKRSEHVFMQVFNDLNIIGVIVCHHVQNVTPEFGHECFSECLTPNKPLLTVVSATLRTAVTHRHLRSTLVVYCSGIAVSTD